MSRSHRLFDLIQVLRRHRTPVSGATLARETGVSLRTIRRDIATLQTMGADIDAEAGIGYSLRPGFLMPPLAFTEQELHALAIGAEWAAHQADEELATAVREALTKIESVLAPRMRDALDGSSYYVKEAGLPAGTAFDLAQCRRAVREERKMRITWREDLTVSSDQGVTTDLIVWPIMLGFDDGAQSFAGWCERDGTFRRFDAERIVAAELLDVRYPRPRRQLVKEWRAVAAAACDARNRR